MDKSLIILNTLSISVKKQINVVLNKCMDVLFGRSPTCTHGHKGDEEEDSSSRQDDVEGTSF